MQMLPCAAARIDFKPRLSSTVLHARSAVAYPDAGHSFMNNHHGFVFKLFRFSGIGYNDPATLDARRRITAFFLTHLDG